MRLVWGGVLVGVLLTTAPAHADGISASVPTVATTVSDGLTRVLPPGTHTVSLPVWLAPGQTGRSARITASGSHLVSCPAVPLKAGAVVRVRCSFVSQGATVVRVWAGASVVRSWSHSGR